MLDRCRLRMVTAIASVLAVASGIAVSSEIFGQELPGVVPNFAAFGEAAAATSDPPTISGRVTDKSDGAVVGALVQWGYIYDPPEKWRQTTTDLDGRYELQVKEWGGNYRLGVSAEGLAPQWHVVSPSWYGLGRFRSKNDQPSEIKRPRPPSEMNFQLEPQHWLTGIVVDQQGNPIPAVTITAETAITGFHSSFSMPSPSMTIPGAAPRATSTGPDGRFSLDQLPADEVQLTLSTPHRHLNASNYKVDQDLRLVMSGSGRSGKLAIQVVDDAHNDPVVEYTVKIRHRDKAMAVADENGRCEIDTDITLGKTYSVYIHSEQFAPGSAKIKAVALDSDKFEQIVMRSAKPIRGQIVDAETGKPVVDAKILYGVPGEQFGDYFEWTDFPRYADGYHSLSNVQHPDVDEQARFWVSESPGGSGTFCIIAPGYERRLIPAIDRPRAGDDGYTVFKLHAESAIVGRLVRDGQPQSNVEVWIHSLAQNDVNKKFGVPPMHPIVVNEMFETARTDADGKFAFRSLAAGKYQLSHAFRISRSRSTYRKLPDVDLQPGQTATLEPITIGATEAE